jgi:1-aminocyclopropane-1-carboxylate deaminase/D-cysteine desulfhydrase-like pyridoxal-dependent ACC family enzyme
MFMLTPIEQRAGIYLKRDDLYHLPGIPIGGAKVRAIYALAQAAHGLISFGSRQSDHIYRVAAVAAYLTIPCRLHLAGGTPTPSVQAAIDLGSQMVSYKAGYLSVLQARAREDAQTSGWTLIPFGVICQEAVNQVAAQTANLPADIRRLVVAVGSGISLAGILQGLHAQGRATPVLGILVGKDPIQTLKKYAPPEWPQQVELIHSPFSYEKEAPKTELAGLRLNPIYEAKCLPYLRSGDLFWIIG